MSKPSGGFLQTGYWYFLLPLGSALLFSFCAKRRNSERVPEALIQDLPAENRFFLHHMNSSHPKAPRWQHALFLLVVLLAGILTRLPQLSSPHMVLDGDEAIVGLMAKHILAGKPVTLYFYGQKYGFAYLEALVGALSFKVFGYGALQLKAAMLGIWLGALAFFYLAAARFTTPFRGFCLALLFTVIPAWAVWSLKARGGYLTSFFFASILVYLFADRRKDFKALAWLGIGLKLGIIFYAQAFWLAGLFPLIAYHFYKYARKRNLLWLGLGILLVAGFFHVFGSATSNFWQPEVIGHNKHFFEPWQKLPDRFFTHLTGYYYLFYLYKPDAITRICAAIWMGLFVVFTGVQFYRAWRFLAGRRAQRITEFTLAQSGTTNAQNLLLQKFRAAPETEKPRILKVLGQMNFLEVPFFQKAFASGNTALRKVAAKNLYMFGSVSGHLLWLSVWFTLGYNLFFNEVYFGYRYMLPISGFMLLWLGAEFDFLKNLRLLPKAVYLVLIPALLVIGSLSLYNFRNYVLHYFTRQETPAVGTEQERLDELITFLKERQIYHVFSSDNLLEWLVAFYSNEEITTRAIPNLDRYPEYVKKVNQAYKEGKPVAIIGYYELEKRLDTLFLHPEKIQRIGHWYYVYLNPSHEDLVRIGFLKVKAPRATPAYIEERLQKTKNALTTSTSR